MIFGSLRSMGGEAEDGTSSDPTSPMFPAVTGPVITSSVATPTVSATIKRANVNSERLIGEQDLGIREALARGNARCRDGGWGAPPSRITTALASIERKHDHRSPTVEAADRGERARHEPRGQRAPAARYRDVLLAIHRVADDASPNPGTNVKVPQVLAVGRVIGMNDSIRVAIEHQIAGGRQHTTEARNRAGNCALDVHGQRIHRVEASARRGIRRRDRLELRNAQV